MKTVRILSIFERRLFFILLQLTACNKKPPVGGSVIRAGGRGTALVGALDEKARALRFGWFDRSTDRNRGVPRTWAGCPCYENAAETVMRPSQNGIQFFFALAREHGLEARATTAVFGGGFLFGRRVGCCELHREIELCVHAVQYIRRGEGYDVVGDRAASFAIIPCNGVPIFVHRQTDPHL